MFQRLVASAAIAIAASRPYPPTTGRPGGGRRQNGISPEKSLPLKWSAAEGVTWKLAMPTLSGSTPIIWGDSIFLSVAEGADEGDPLSLWCVNRADGAVRWKQPMDTGNHKVRKGDMTSPSPVTDGKTVWLLTGTGVISAFDFAGKELWTRDLQKDYGKLGLNHGYGSSPLLYDGDLFVQVLHGMNTDDPSVRAADRRQDRQDDVEGRAADRRHARVARLLHDAGAGPPGQGGRDRGHRRRRRHRSRSGHRQGAVAVARAQPREQPVLPHRRVAARGRRHRLRADARQAAARGAAGGRGDVTDTHELWAFDKGPDVPTPVTDGK